MNTVVFHLITIINFLRLFIFELPDLILSGIICGIGLATRNQKLFIYGKNNAKAVDLRGNACLWGDPQETISARLGRSVGKERYIWVKWFRQFVDMMFFFDYIELEDGTIIRHCQKSIDSNIEINEELWPWGIDG